jgi:hypothetical protein
LSINEYTGRLARWSLLLQEFSFDIEYKKGVLHVNADALSRPVLVKQILDDDSNEKNLDPYDNEALLQYIEFRRHMNGVSKKQIKRVEKLAQHYTLSEGVLMYRKDVSDLNYVVVPKKEARTEIITKQHVKGHFQCETTYLELKKTYY